MKLLLGRTLTLSLAAGLLASARPNAIATAQVSAARNLTLGFVVLGSIHATGSGTAAGAVLYVATFLLAGVARYSGRDSA